jgi:pimeloyl-ACP methyl ester carboxylesterase
VTGAVLAATEYGAADGAPVVALHGALGTKERFARIGTEGLPERRWIALDLRGFGDSVRSPPWTIPQCAEDVLATLDALGVEEADVLGTSLGGRVAFALAKLAPSRVRSVVAVDPAVATAEEYRARKPYEAVFEADTIDELLGSVSRAPREARDWARRDALAAIERAAAGRYRRRMSEEAIAALRASMPDSLPPSLGAFAGRVLLLRSGKTTFVTEAGLALLRAELGDRLEVLTFPDAGHVVLTDAFGEVVSAVAAFLDGVERSRLLVETGSAGRG